jgi:hypothetical protein
MWFCTKTYHAKAIRDIGNDHEDVSQQGETSWKKRKIA